MQTNGAETRPSKTGLLDLQGCHWSGEVERDPIFFFGFRVLTLAFADEVSVMRCGCTMAKSATRCALVSKDWHTWTDALKLARRNPLIKLQLGLQKLFVVFRPCSTRSLCKTTSRVFWFLSAFSVPPYAKNKTHSSNPLLNATQQNDARLSAWGYM